MPSKLNTRHSQDYFGRVKNILSTDSCFHANEGKVKDKLKNGTW